MNRLRSATAWTSRGPHNFLSVQPRYSEKRMALKRRTRVRDRRLEYLSPERQSPVLRTAAASE
jgi:hypothetical protein